MVAKTVLGKSNLGTTECVLVPCAPCVFMQRWEYNTLVQYLRIGLQVGYRAGLQAPEELEEGDLATRLD